MTDIPAPVRARLTRLERRLGLAAFLDVWPVWAAAALAVAALAVLACRIAYPAAARFLPWLWTIPIAAAVPAIVFCRVRRFSDGDVAVLADSLAGGSGTLLAVLETGDRAWTDSGLLERASAFPLPRLHAWRKMATLGAALVFLALTLALPQRTPAASAAALADDIARDLKTTVAELQQQKLVTPEEEKALDEAIEKIRRGAEQRMDASSWEAADALREKLAADVAEKQNAAKWAQDSLSRYAAALQAAGPGTPGAQAQAAELTQALEKLAKSGLLAGAPEKLKQLLKSGKLPTDPAALRELAGSLSKYLDQTNGRFGDLAKLGKEFGRFNPDEFPLAHGENGDAMQPGNCGLDRGRGDAPLTWGKETAPFDRFKARALPPGTPRRPDDWTPVVELPGAPQVAPEAGAAAAGRAYEATAGQSAWRRSLAPRHQSAVKKYFAK